MLCLQMRITVSHLPVRMVAPVWMIMVATHVNVLINGLVKIVQVFISKLHNLLYNSKFC